MADNPPATAEFRIREGAAEVKARYWETMRCASSTSSWVRTSSPLRLTSAQREKPTPALKLNFLSHGTLESRDLAFSRRFYEEVLGLEVVQTSAISLLIRLGGSTRGLAGSRGAREPWRPRPPSPC